MSASDEEWVRHKCEDKCGNPNCDADADCVYRDKTPQIEPDLAALIQQEVDRLYKPYYDELAAAKKRLGELEKRMSHLLKAVK